MELKEKVKLKEFWANFLKVTLPFFIILTVLTLLWKSWSAIINADFNLIAEENFKNGKWKPFFGVKLIASVIYGLYVTNKNMK